MVSGGARISGGAAFAATPFTPHPLAAFTVSPSGAGYNPGLTNTQYFFTDISTLSPTSWSWTFGDGGTSTAQNPSHTFTLPGRWTVTETVFNAGGHSSTTYQQAIALPVDYLLNFSGSANGAWVTPALLSNGIISGSALAAVLQLTNFDLITATNQMFFSNNAAWTNNIPVSFPNQTIDGAAATNAVVYSFTNGHAAMRVAFPANATVTVVFHHQFVPFNLVETGQFYDHAWFLLPHFNEEPIMNWHVDTVAGNYVTMEQVSPTEYGQWGAGYTRIPVLGTNGDVCRVVFASTTNALCYLGVYDLANGAWGRLTNNLAATLVTNAPAEVHFGWVSGETNSPIGGAPGMVASYLSVILRDVGANDAARISYWDNILTNGP